MSNNENYETYYSTLGLSPDATLDQVKTRYKELNNAYLKILELSRKTSIGTTSRNAPAGSNTSQMKPHPKADSGQEFSSLQETHTEPIAVLKEKLAKRKINMTQFEKLAKERYDYLKNKPFSELSDSELEERLKGFEGLKVDLKYWKPKS